MPETGPGPFKIDQLLRQEDELLHLWQDVALPDLVSRGPLFTGRPKAFIETTRRMELWLGSMQLFRCQLAPENPPMFASEIPPLP